MKGKRKLKPQSHMVEICQICGDEGYHEALISCINCSDSAGHIYCLGLLPEDICDDISWICDSCVLSDKQSGKKSTNGDEQDITTKYAGATDTKSLPRVVSDIFETENDEVRDNTQQPMATVPLITPSSCHCPSLPSSPRVANQRIISSDGGSYANKRPRKKNRAQAIVEEEEEIRRGVTVMNDVVKARAKGKKFKIEWNAKNQVIGDNSSMFVSFLGVVVRQKVPITIFNWRQVSQEIKNAIWDEMHKTFVLEQHNRKYVMQVAGKLARSFRSLLSLIYLKDEEREWLEKPPQEPPRNYPQISQDAWTLFVTTCYSDEYQSLSAANRAKAKLQTTVFSKGRKGYAGVEQDLLKEKAKSLLPETLLPDKIPRHQLYLYCRQLPDGSFESKKWPALKEVADKIDILSQRQALGECISHEDGPNDILAQALNKPEHPGRLRGLGFGVSKKKYFPNQKYCSYQEMEQMRAELRAMKQQMADLMATGPTVPVVPSVPANHAV